MMSLNSCNLQIKATLGHIGKPSWSTNTKITTKYINTVDFTFSPKGS